MELPEKYLKMTKYGEDGGEHSKFNIVRRYLKFHKGLSEEDKIV